MAQQTAVEWLEQEIDKVWKGDIMYMELPRDIYYKLIKNAKEIHSVGTGPFHVVDRITDFNYNCLFYFHNVRDDFKTIDTRLKWNLIEYEQTPLGYWRSNSR